MQERTYATPSPRSFACDLATLCAPTLAGLKPASLFRYQPAPGQDAAAMAAAWHTELSPRGVTVQVLKQCPRTGAVLVYVYRPARWQSCWLMTARWHFWQGRATPPAQRTSCWRSWPSGSAVSRISRMRSAFFWATRWRMSSGSSKTAAKTLPRAATGRSTLTRPLRRRSLTATKSASASTPAAITTAPQSAGLP